MIIGTIAAPMNLRPGYLLQASRDLIAVNGTPPYSSADNVYLNAEGYYEVDVGDAGQPSTRYPICIVDPVGLSAGISPPTVTDQPPAFTRLSLLLARCYPRGRVIPFVSDHSQGLDATTNKAVVLEVRSRALGGTYARMGEVLAKGPGTWRSGSFGLLYGTNDIRVAAVFSDQETVLA